MRDAEIQTGIICAIPKFQKKYAEKRKNIVYIRNFLSGKLIVY